MGDAHDDRLARQREAEVLRLTSSMITLFDMNGEVLMQNPAAALAFGARGAAGNSFVGRCRDPGVGQRVLAKLRHEASFIDDIEVETLAGTRWHAVTGHRTQDPVSGQLAIVVDQWDASERKSAELALLRTREAALEASRVKSQFLANMSHEIRTPLNGVLGMLQLTLATELTQEQREFLAAAHASGEGLLHIIDDILDLSKIEAGKLEVESVELTLQDVLRDSLQTVAPRAHAKGLELFAELAPDVPETLLGDPVRLRQVLTNLVGNAVKFTELGHVRVSLSVARESGTAELIGEVQDTGIGIAAERQAGVFEAFEQADGSTTRRYGGTGLGLKICRQLLGMMGGRLTLESALGAGSTFRFAIPLRLPKTVALAPRLAASRDVLGGERVLVVDDHPHARAAIIAQLERLGGVVSSAATIKQAFAVAGADARAIHAAFIDQGLGLERGCELAKLLRPLPACRETRFILLRSQERVSRAQLNADGFEFGLDKPVLPDDLRGSLTGALIRSPATNHHSRPLGLASAPDLPPLRLLVVEDHPINAHFLGALLRRQGHHVVHAWNGARGLTAYAEGSFDAILMDVQMPEMDGLEATRRIRELEKTRGTRVPIIALTANAMKGDEDACLLAGMDHYVSKPVDPSSLVQALARFFGRDVDTPARPRLLTPMPEPDRGAPAFGREELLERAAGDPRLMADLMQMFLATQGEMMREVERGVRSGSCEAVREAAHRLKGALQLVCATPAATFAKNLEHAARRQQPERFGNLLGGLRHELQRLRAALGDSGA